MNTQKLIEAVEALKTPDDKMLGGMGDIIPLTANHAIDQVLTLIREHAEKEVQGVDEAVENLNNAILCVEEKLYCKHDPRLATPFYAQWPEVCALIRYARELSRLRTQPAQQWQPIETAPRDGAWIMAYWPSMPISTYPVICYYEEGAYGNPNAWSTVRTNEYGCDEVYPTHWMPLPLSPKVEISNEP